MAEVLAVMSGAVTVASLFSSCVDCLGYVQLGRHFARDYHVCRLQLDVAEMRMVRWKEVVNLDKDSRSFESDNRETQTIKTLLTEMEGVLTTVKRKAERYKRTASVADLKTCEDDKDMAAVPKKVHQRLRRVIGRRQESNLFVQKAAWALYDREQFKRMIAEVLELLDELEKVLQVEEACRQRAEAQISEVGDVASLQVLQEAARGTDPLLLDVVCRKGEALGSHNFARDIKAADQADVQVGDQFSQTVLMGGTGGGPAFHGANNTVHGLDAKGSAKVQIGSRFG
ncbi:small s protein [Grosmannia clavigera kw1407]|uniref:Small s protein n=1 Tax=Grosmannia clavigera (strain kw1407 / UAMH 11150) TaxID=655863 RepID=F0XBA7_GROCL|nr:small s protein [Grosmannia clavigera kw1407]EFX05012.1 small s protein [Grosmannia clavigera kw1407]